MTARRSRPLAAKVKTSLSLPPALWRAARIRALQDEIDAGELVARAIRAYLEAKPTCEGYGPDPKGGRS